MIYIDEYTTTLVFNGDFHLTGSTGTTLRLTDKQTNSVKTFSLTDVVSYTLRYTEFAFPSGYTEQLDAGQYFYELIHGSNIKENGICKVVGIQTIIPVYLNDMSEYKIYKNL